MIFIGGISQGMKALAYTGLITCSFCKSTTSCELLMTYYYFSFFFIPLFKWNTSLYAHNDTFRHLIS